MRRSTAVAAVAGLFLLGILVGVLGTHLFYLRQIRQPGGLAELGGRIVANNLDRRLDLTVEQRREIDRILADTSREAAALRREMMPRMLEILERSQRRVAAALTPAQRKEFESFRRENASKVRRLIAGE